MVFGKSHAKPARVQLFAERILEMAAHFVHALRPARRTVRRIHRGEHFVERPADLAENPLRLLVRAIDGNDALAGSRRDHVGKRDAFQRLAFIQQPRDQLLHRRRFVVRECDAAEDEDEEKPAHEI